MQELFLKPIIVSKDDMDRFGKNEMKKIRPIKNTWYDWLINYISEPKRKSVCGFKGKIVSLFKTNTPKQNVYGRLSKSKAQNIRNPFMLKKKKNKNTDRVIRDIRKLFEQQEGDYYKPKRVDNVWNNNYIEYESNDEKTETHH